MHYIIFLVLFIAILDYLDKLYKQAINYLLSIPKATINNIGYILLFITLAYLSYVVYKWYSVINLEINKRNETNAQIQLQINKINSIARR